MVIKCCQATESQDVFAADVLYHHSCYNRFAYSYEEKSITKTERTNKEISVISAEEELKVLIKRKILIQKKMLSPYRPCRRNGDPMRDFAASKER